MTDSNRRKVVNAVIDPKAQLRAFIPIFVIFMWSFGTIFFIYWKVISFGKDAVSSDLGMQMSSSVAELTAQVLIISVVGIVGLAFLSVGLWMVFSHRVFGPTVPIQRQLGKLIEGSYDGEIKLRKNDELKDIAESLNILTRTLQQKDTR